MGRKGILFDLDGTLWDSAEAVTLSWNRVLERIGRPERMTTEWMYTLMGKTMDDIAMAMFPTETHEEAVRVLGICMEDENAYIRKHGGKLFPGLEEILRELKSRGWFLGSVSNCQEGYIEAFLAYHRLEKYFDDTENVGHTGQGKGYNIRLVVERNRLERAIYIGDTQGDYDAATEAGVPFLHAAYGFGTVPAGTASISDIRELPDAAEKLLS